ncbi:hypothetical protein RM780_10340 [Streptomyces sp. DSM 44917]|uniref:Uncharacterized protein n=1 Tax=Streptomyces boetiae TaxID=3075541 RepID=A0ABU2L708_9ACTN|nr:hypothetical protein [Streptomyces sp. DSM 44917]MDT0307360.1 hypothetical protein [Streptomyces sp. DSM 44917]
MTERVRADQTALWSSAVATVITLSIGDGRFDWLCLALGTAQALQMAAFYRPVPREAGDRWGRWAAAGAFGAVGGLIAVMTLGWPVQTVVGTPSNCAALSEISAIAVHNCSGFAAYRWLGLVWATSAAGLAFWHWRAVAPKEAAP